MNYIKKHKTLFIVLVLLFILVIFMSIYIFFYQTNSNKYGNRLNGIENVHINESKIDDVKQEVLKNDNCISISYKLDGKLIKFFMKVKPDTDELTLESIFNVILTKFTEEEKSFYDFEIFVNSKEGANNFPVIAYKHRNKEVFSISRKEVKTSEE